jgi:DNA repair exonuclease SbcCD ATPase subunit
MKNISLTGIQLAHFRSFVQPTPITLSVTPGLKLISGDNKVEPRLGGNGCGKSTIWDAVCFALYGVSVNGLRASDLTTQGEQTVEAAVYLTVNGEEHLVHRVSPPMRVYLDTVQVEQADIQQLVGLSKTRFLNSVIFGQAAPLFIDLPVPARGDLLDEVLELELWMRAAEKANEQHRDKRTKLNEQMLAQAATVGAIEGLGDLTRFDRQIAAYEADKQARINEVLDAFEAAEREHAELAKEHGSKTLNLIAEEEARRRYEHMYTAHTQARERVASLTAEKDELGKNVSFLQKHDTCPVCDQPITVAHIRHHQQRIRPRLAELNNALETAQLDTQTTAAELPASEATWRGMLRENHEKRAKKTLLERQMAYQLQQMDRLEREAERLSEEANPYRLEAERANQEFARLTAQKTQQEAAIAVNSDLLTSLDFWRQGFKKVRLYCLDSVLQKLVIETRNSLLSLGLVGWQINFTTATETKSGTVRLGVQVEIHSPHSRHKFEYLSGGESQRARLAVSLGLANLIQRWAGVRFDLEVFDEPTAWLSEQGVEDLLESLRVRAEASDRSIWVCDHRALAHAVFSETLHVIKTAQGSAVV